MGENIEAFSASNYVIIDNGRRTKNDDKEREKKAHRGSDGLQDNGT